MVQHSWDPKWALDSLALSREVREALREWADELRMEEKKRAQEIETTNLAEGRTHTRAFLEEPSRAAPLHVPARAHGQVRLYDPLELEAFRTSLTRHHSASEEQRRAKAIVKELGDRGPWRWPLIASRAMLRRLCALELEFPNFIEVVAHIRATLVLYRGAVILQPVLLDGPPGCGKTSFAMRLAEVLRTPFRLVDAAATSASFALVGSDKAYENSQSGLVHEVLSGNCSIAPVIVVDELDKAAVSDARYPLINSLYGFWEPRTAQVFRDASVPQVALDTRFVLWVCTSNDATLIPGPILNRVRLFHIRPPGDKEMEALVFRLAKEVWRDARRRGVPPELGSEVLHRLCRMPVRTAKLTLAELFAKAVLAGRKTVCAEDLPNVASVESHRPGFV